MERRAVAAWAGIFVAIVLVSSCREDGKTTADLQLVPCCPRDTAITWTDPPSRADSTSHESVIRLRFDGGLVSEDARLHACNYRMENEEGGAAVILCDGDRVLGMQPFARAIAWEPDGSRLLCYEAEADDDLRMFLLDVGRGEYRKDETRRNDYVFGERNDRFLEWKGDSIRVENVFMSDTLRFRWVKLGR